MRKLTIYYIKIFNLEAKNGSVGWNGLSRHTTGAQFAKFFVCLFSFVNWKLNDALNRQTRITKWATNSPLILRSLCRLLDWILEPHRPRD